MTIATETNVPALVASLQRGEPRIVLPGTDLKLVTARVTAAAAPS